MHTNKGFTLVEVIISLFIVSISCILLYTILHTLVLQQTNLYEAEDEVSIKQMRLLFALSKEASIEDDTLSFLYKNEEMQFEYYDHKLVLKPGYQIFLNDLDEYHFVEEEHCIYLTYKHTDKDEKTRIIGCL